MTAPGGPDWAALYQRHRQGMYRVAARVLRDAGLADQAEDAVQNAMTSLMASPPSGTIRSWQALLVETAKRRALDIVGSGAVRRDGGGLDTERDDRGVNDCSSEVEERVDNARALIWRDRTWQAPISPTPACAEPILNRRMCGVLSLTARIS